MRVPARRTPVHLRSRAWWVAVLVSATCACGVPPHACTLIGGINTVGITLGQPMRGHPASIRVRLCQSHRCRSTAFDTAPAAAHGAQLGRGVMPSANGDGYVVDLDRALGGGWTPSPEATIDVRAVDARGDVVARRHETFHWGLGYPNGKDCDEHPFLHHTVTLAP